MKHNLKITFILLAMFVVTQLIGLYVVNHYMQDDNTMPYGMQPPEEVDPVSFFPSIVIAFIIAIVLLILLTKFNAAFILRLWFFIVVAIALALSFVAIFPKFKYATLIFFLIAIAFAFFKIYKRSFLVHNLTELFIYPGIAAVFVPLLNLWTIIILLIIISIYDMWAVWHSGIMQKMAKYQIDKLKIFSGFFVPYVSPKVKMRLRKLKKSELKTKKIKVNVAILGGGDVIFPIITAGVMLKASGTILIGGFSVPLASLLVILGATLALTYLFFFAEKKKFYPAMPFITAGIFAGMLIYWAIAKLILSSL